MLSSRNLFRTGKSAGLGVSRQAVHPPVDSSMPERESVICAAWWFIRQWRMAGFTGLRVAQRNNPTKQGVANMRVFLYYSHYSTQVLQAIYHGMQESRMGHTHTQ